MEDTITLEQLWVLFSKIKRVSYGSSVEIRSDYKANTEMIYNSYQKELIAQASFGMN